MLKSLLKISLLFLLHCFFAGAVLAQTGKETSLKAAFIYNFTKYIDWDTDNADDNFVIGVIGTSPVTEVLMQVAKTNTTKNKKIVIKVFIKPEEIGHCNVLFIPSRIPFSLKSILDKVGKGVLTISEDTDYAKQGTAINFIIKEDKLKFEANVNTINAAGLKASSQLLKLAIIVY